MKTEVSSIMPPNDQYSTTRFNGSHRHEIYAGRTGNRDKSIEDGLVVFLTWEQHEGNNSVHKNPKKWTWLKELGEKTWIEYYGKTKEDFRNRYGRNYI